MTRKPWNECELLLLEGLRDAEDRGEGPRYFDLARDIGLNESEATQVLDDLLAEGFVTAEAVQKDGQGRYAVAAGLRLGPKGRRRLGLWPSDNATAEQFIAALVELLDDRIASSDHLAERSTLDRLKGALRDAPAAVLTSLVVTAAGKVTGLA